LSDENKQVRFRIVITFLQLGLIFSYRRKSESQKTRKLQIRSLKK